MARIKKGIRKYLIYSGILLFFVLLLLLIRIDLVAIITIVVLIALGCLSKVYKRITSISIGFELVTIAVILFAHEIGIIFAIIAGAFMVIASEFISGRIIPNALMFEIFGYIIIAIVVGIFSSSALVPLAIVMIIFRNVWLFTWGVMFGTDAFRMFLGTFPNIFINGFIIAKLGIILAQLL